MGKLYDRLQEQLKTEYKQDAEDCLIIYNYLNDSTDHIWESQWQPLVSTIYKGFPSDERRYKPTAIGNLIIKGLNNKCHCSSKKN